MSENTDKMTEDQNTEEISAEEAVGSLQDEVGALNDKYLRVAADFENFKRRTQKERSDLIKYAGEGIVRDLLDVFDSLKLATNQEVPDEAKSFMDGVSKIFQQFEGVLIKHSIKSYPTVGEQFDPNKHEAVATVPTAEEEPGTILQEYKSLFFFKDKLLRPAQVVVAKEQEKGSEEEE